MSPPCLHCNQDTPHLVALCDSCQRRPQATSEALRARLRTSPPIRGVSGLPGASWGPLSEEERRRFPSYFDAVRETAEALTSQFLHQYPEATADDVADHTVKVLTVLQHPEAFLTSIV